MTSKKSVLTLIQVFKRFVEAGRVAVVNFGDDNGKLGVVVDILDENRVLVDGPTTGLERAVYPVKHLAMTDIKVSLLKGARTGTVKKAVESEDVVGQWEKSSWGKKKAAQAKRAALTDFERFKVMINRKRRAFILRHTK